MPTFKSFKEKFQGKTFALQPVETANDEWKSAMTPSAKGFYLGLGVLKNVFLYMGITTAATVGFVPTLFAVLAYAGGSIVQGLIRTMVDSKAGEFKAYAQSFNPLTQPFRLKRK